MKIRSGKIINPSTEESFIRDAKKSKSSLFSINISDKKLLTKAQDRFNSMRACAQKNTRQSWQSRAIQRTNGLTKNILRTLNLDEELPGRWLRIIRSFTSSVAPIFLPKPAGVVAENYSFSPVENAQVPYVNLDDFEAAHPFITGECVRPEYYDLTRPMAERKAVIYCPGGGYFVCHVNLHGAVSGRIARDAYCEVYALNYRLLPEHAYPAALNDVITLYNNLLAHGYKPENIILAGDSAGAHLATVFVHHVQRCIQEQKIKDMKLACALLALLSPSLDFSMVDELERGHVDPLFPLPMIPLIGKKLGRKLSDAAIENVLQHPAISPAYLDLKEIGRCHPPVWAACDSRDVFSNSVDTFFKALREHEIPEHIHTGHISHGGYLIPHYLPEAGLMMQELTDTISHLLDTTDQREFDAQKSINEGGLDLQGFPL